MTRLNVLETITDLYEHERMSSATWNPVTCKRIADELEISVQKCNHFIGQLMEECLVERCEMDGIIEFHPTCCNEYTRDSATIHYYKERRNK